MTENVKRLYKEAMNNEDFDKDMRRLDPKGYKKPSRIPFISSSTLKHLYAATYYGWLLGKGLYTRENYVK